MNARFLTKPPIAVILFASAVMAGQAQAYGPKDSPFSADRYGYVFHLGSRAASANGAASAGRDAYVSNARFVDQFSGGTRGKFEPNAEGTQPSAGLNRRGKFDVFSEGARA